MHVATQALIAARTPYCTRAPELVNVTRIGGGIIGRCFDNSYSARKMRPSTMMVCGWCVSRWKNDPHTYSIMAHWWNFTNGEHWDTTPLIGDDEEYVLDRALHEYAFEHNDELDSHVPSSLVFRDSGMFSVVKPHEDRDWDLMPIAHLTTHALFSDSLIVKPRR